MQTSYFLSIVCGLWAVLSVLASPHGAAPTVCQTDKCLNAFRATKPATALSEASKYCSQYLSTSIDYVVVKALVKTTKTVVLADQTITADMVTATETISTAHTTTITTGLDKLKARAEDFPTFAKDCTATGTTEKAAQVSSACSCILVNTPPVTTKTKTNTILETAPTKIPLTTFTPSTTETKIVTTTVFVYVAPPPNCDNPLTCK